MVFLGAESGSDETLKRMNKGGTASTEKTLAIAQKMKQYGIVPELSFVLGNPPDPEADTRQTMEFIRKVKRVNPAAEIILYMYTPVPLAGELYEEAKAEGFQFPETLEEWISPEWLEFSQRRSANVPWLHDPLAPPDPRFPVGAQRLLPHRHRPSPGRAAAGRAAPALGLALSPEVLQLPAGAARIEPLPDLPAPGNQRVLERWLPCRLRRWRVQETFHPAPLTTVAVAVLAFACALAVLIAHVLLPSAARRTHGFVSGYTASRLLLSGGFGPRVYDEGWYMRQVQLQTGWEVQEIFSPNPPTFALLSLPFAWLAPQAGKAAWLWASLAFLGLGVWLSAKVFLQELGGLRLPALILLAAFALLSGPVVSNFAWGQSYILVFLLLAGALWGLAPTPSGRGLAPTPSGKGLAPTPSGRGWPLRLAPTLPGRERLAGVCLGLALLLKANGALLLIPLLARRRWRVLGWSLGTALGVALAALPWTGWEVWAAYPAAIRAFLADPSVSVSAYQGLYGFLSHLLRYDPTWNPTPLAVLPGLVQPLYLFLLALATAITLWLGRQASLSALLAAFVSLNVFFTPIAEEYHFAALLIPLIFLAREFTLPDPPAAPAFGGQLALAGTMLLLGLPMAAISPAHTDGWLALLAYPRLYAGILVWVLTLVRLAT